ncbi:hypothetical protein QCE73_08780 [Caballeronia sp. LZ029]|uniref:hypothetical protein n=1 Tax=Caballeronia sp. LZ029 TaxID=3038564 RepID=UPI00285C3E79|nr:hypothetical protein [Caballeronia sp. LZ029]MDR5743248.1 hypothetical protein [Caballeronia sp. LZ029]
MGISIREFGRRERCDESTVRRAIREGRLSRLPNGKLDAALVGSPWRPANFERAAALTVEESEAMKAALDELDGALDDEPSLSYADAVRLKTVYAARLARLEYELRSGALIELDEAEQVLFSAFRNVRDALLAWPSRVAPLLAADLDYDDAERLQATLYERIHALLIDLGEPTSFAVSA